MLVLQALECLWMEAPVCSECLPHALLLVHKRHYRAGVRNQAAAVQHPHLPLVCSLLPVPQASPCWTVSCRQLLYDYTAHLVVEVKTAEKVEQLEDCKGQIYSIKTIEIEVCVRYL